MNFGKMMYRAAQRSSTPLDTIEARAENVLNTNASRVRTAADEQPYCNAIKDQKQRGKEADVEGTPTLFVNGHMLKAPTLDELTSATEKRLDR